MYKHYIRTNQEGEVISAFSNAFVDPGPGDICLTPDGTDERHFSLALTTEAGVARYVYTDGQLIERSSSDLETAPGTISYIKESLCSKIEGLKFAVMRHGFEFQNGRIQGDDEAQSNLMAWVLLDSKGALTYPKAWRRADNTFMAIPDAQALEALAAAMGTFKDSAYSGIFQAKDSIRVAQTVAEATALFDAWVSSINLAEVNS